MAIATSENLQVLLQVGKKTAKYSQQIMRLENYLNEKEIEATQKDIEELKQVLKAKESEVHENNRTQRDSKMR